MSLEPEREPVVYPVYRWLEIADSLRKHGDGALARAISRAMDARRLSDTATFELTAEERERIAEVEGERT